MLEYRLGTGHYQVAISLNNLAMFYKAQKRYEEAELLYKRSLQILEKQLSHNHSFVVFVQENLKKLHRQHVPPKN
ncbi:tetratricopeptide repeat protein [Trichocoleus sp. FACHB-262]|uniref:tetratricopeptide repeat protein n=1 Tax=Trichocoleus sp. FACHB-262 TaxID=2692869 RepID=UPI0037DDA5F7